MNVSRFHAICPLSLSDFSHSCHMSTNFSRNRKKWNLPKMYPMGVALLTADRRTDIKRWIVAVCNCFAEAQSGGGIVIRREDEVNCFAHKAACDLINPLNAELNPICYLLALLGAHSFLHVSRIRVKSLTFRLLISYIYGAPFLDVSRSHTTTHHSR